MKNKEKTGPINSLGENVDKLTVQKSQQLQALCNSDLTLAEFKILDTYLARIDSRNPERRIVRFEKGELESILGLKRILPDVLDDRLKNLMTTIKIPDNNAARGFTRISLFEKAHAEQDEFGMWSVELECTPSAMKYIFNIEEIGYLRYKLRSITPLKSRYSYIMFLYLENHRHMGLKWKVTVEELKQILHCENEETYKQFYRFNDLILKKVQKEIHEKTECRFNYKPLRRGHSVTGIEIALESKSIASKEELLSIDDILGDDDSDIFDTETKSETKTAVQKAAESFIIDLDEYGKHEPETKDSVLYLLQEALGCHYTKTKELERMVYKVPVDKLPKTDIGVYNEELSRIQYVKNKIRVLREYDNHSFIENKFNYMYKMINQDIA